MRGGTQQEYTLADLTRITGAKRRSVQLWAEAGVIRAKGGTERQGTGTHRRFTKDEAMIACAVHAFAQRQMAIGELLKVATAFRSHLKHPLLRIDFDDALADKIDVFAMFITWKKDWRVEFWVNPDRVNLPEDLTKEGSFVAVIRLNTYLARLR